MQFQCNKATNNRTKSAWKRESVFFQAADCGEIHLRCEHNMHQPQDVLPNLSSDQANHLPHHVEARCASSPFPRFSSLISMMYLLHLQSWLMAIFRHFFMRSLPLRPLQKINKTHEGSVVAALFYCYQSRKKLCFHFCPHHKIWQCHKMAGYHDNQWTVSVCNKSRIPHWKNCKMQQCIFLGKLMNKYMFFLLIS